MLAVLRFSEDSIVIRSIAAQGHVSPSDQEDYYLPEGYISAATELDKLPAPGWYFRTAVE